MKDTVWEAPRALANFSEAEVKTLRGVALERSFAQGVTLFKEGEPGRACLILLQGRVLVCKTIDGKQTTLGMVGAGSMIGQMALVDGRPLSASVVVDSPVRALVLDREVFQKLLRSLSPFALRFQVQIAVAGIRQLRLAIAAIGRLALEAEQERRQRGDPRRRASRTRRRGSATIQAGLSEISLDLESLDKVEVMAPRGQVAKGRTNDW